MISRVHSSILQGIDAIACGVEAAVASGAIGAAKLGGLAEAAVSESVGRTQAALRAVYTSTARLPIHRRLTRSAGGS